MNPNSLSLFFFFFFFFFLALRGAATLKARALKEVWNISSVLPVDKGAATKGNMQHTNGGHNQEAEPHQPENFHFAHTQDLLARGTELLKRTRKGVLSELLL